jgi:hypothetical protein
MLSEAGLGDYWDDVDGVVRNQLVESQHVEADLIRAQMGGQPFVDYLQRQKKNQRKMAQADWLGGFVGAMHVNAFPKLGLPASCCGPNGASGLYYAWESGVRHADGVVRVNLLLNRASPWLDVDSYLPYEGKVVVRNKTARTVAVRVPGWAKKEAVVSRIDDRRATPFWVGNYLVFEGLGKNDVVTVEFPMVEETVQYTVADRLYLREEQPEESGDTPIRYQAGEFLADGGGPASGDAGGEKRTRYTCHFKGNTLVEISPHLESSVFPIYKRERHPTYQRDHYKGNRAPMKETTRYVAPIAPKW